MEDWDKARLAAALGANIGRMRQEEGMTQAELAERLGIGEEAVSRIERGMVIPALPRLYDIAHELRRTAGELLLRASPRVHDQAAAMSLDMERLSPADREMVAEIVFRLVARLTTPRRRASRG